MRADQPPADDVRVRQALKAATDNAEILEVVGLGLGSVGNNSPIGPALGDFYLDVPPPEQDIEKAKQLLAEAGYEDGLEIELTTMDTLATRSIATVWAEQLAEAGVTVDIQIIPINTYYGDGVWLECPFGITDWGARSSPQPYLKLAYTCGAPWNSGHWCDEEFDQLADAAGSEMDHEKRAELYHEIQRVFAERGAAIVPYFAQNMLAYRDSVKPGLESGAISTAVEVRTVWLEE
jgi:peptide/nickel transport system substrate-binding protein